MTDAELAEHNAVRDLPDAYYDDDDTTGDAAYEDAVLQGRTAADISHAGEGLSNLEDAEQSNQTLLEQLREHHKYVPFSPSISSRMLH